MATYIANERRNFNATVGDNGSTSSLGPSLALAHNVGPAGVLVVLADAQAIHPQVLLVEESHELHGVPTSGMECTPY